MQMIIKEGSLTYIKDFSTDNGECTTPEEMLLGAYELIAKVYSQKSVIEAYYRTDPDTLSLRD